MSEDLLKRKCRKIANDFKRDNPDDFWVYFPTDKFYSGIPDILACFKSIFGACELKTERGKVTPLQQHTLKEIENAGGVVIVARSADDFKQFLNQLKEKGGNSNGRNSKSEIGA